MRPQPEVEALWAALLADQIDFVASDHSPASPELKQGDDFFALWGGIAGVQTSLLLLLAAQQTHGLSLAQISALTAANVADRFGLHQFGDLRIGARADLALIDLNAPFTLQREQLHDRHRANPFVGQTMGGSVRATLCRGRIIYHHGQFYRPAGAQVIRPQP